MRNNRQAQISLAISRNECITDFLKDLDPAVKGVLLAKLCADWIKSFPNRQTMLDVLEKEIRISVDKEDPQPLRVAS